MSANAYPRRRVSIACEVCRLRKTRCDAKKPACSLCTELEIECDYRKPEAGRRDDVHRDVIVIAQRLDNIEKTLQTLSSAILRFPSGETNTPPFRQNETLSASPAAIAGSDRSASRMPNLLTFTAPSSESACWSYDCTAGFFADQIESAADLRRAVGHGSWDLDCSQPLLWKYQRAFADNVLRWLPLFDHETATRHLQTAHLNANDGSASDCIVLLICAIGALASDACLYIQEADQIPGFAYFAQALKIIDSLPFSSDDLCTLQCRILATVYLLFTLRPLEAWKTITQASHHCIMLLKAGVQVGPPEQLQTFHRIYWICYVLENELEICLEMPPSGLRMHETIVPLPTSHYDEEGMFYLLALASLRKLMVEVVDTVGLRASTTFTIAPVVALELRQQIDHWYQHLPGPLRFPLDQSFLFDTRKAHLRCQYFALIAVVSWPFIMRCRDDLWKDSNVPERARLTNSANECLKAARDYLRAAEEILTQKCLVSHLVIRGYFAMAMILFLVYPETAADHQERSDDKHLLERAFRNLSYWSIVPFMQQPLAEMARIAGLKGITVLA